MAGIIQKRKIYIIFKRLFMYYKNFYIIFESIYISYIRSFFFTFNGSFFNIKWCRWLCHCSSWRKSRYKVILCTFSYFTVTFSVFQQCFLKKLINRIKIIQLTRLCIYIELIRFERYQVWDNLSSQVWHFTETFRY